MIQLCRPTEEDTLAMGFYLEEEYAYMVVVDGSLVFWFEDLSELPYGIKRAFSQEHPIVISPESLICEGSSLEEIQANYPELFI